MDRSAYDRYLEIEQDHFWRIAKRRLVIELIRELFGARRDLRLLDIGGAASLMTRDMKRFGVVECVEPDARTAELARAQHQVVVHTGGLPDQLPPLAKAHVITLLDVVEHIDDDRAALTAVRPLLTPDGVVIVTVPALSWLWSDHDVVLHHKRRYDRRGLLALFRDSGFAVERMSYYTSLLLPLLAASRVASNLRPKKAAPVYDVSVPRAPINALLGAVMAGERALLRRADMPIGSSLFAVIRPLG